MNEAALHTRQCVACTPETPVLPPAEVQKYLQQVPEWTPVEDGKVIRRELRLADFPAAIEFVNTVAGLAEEEQHHPDILMHAYRRVRIDLSTHAIGGLSENDFILAAKIDRVVPGHNANDR